MLENILTGIHMALQWDNMLWAFIGVTGGILLGATPGLTDTMAMCLLMPFTFYLEPTAGIGMLMGLSKGANFGGSIPAILFNLPGTPAAAITAIDGYQLTRQGKAGKALKAALYASCTGDLVSSLILFFVAAPVAWLALRVGPPEYTMIILFSLVIIGCVATENFFHAMLSISLGLFLSVIGTDPMSGRMRLTFGSSQLANGFTIISMVIGLLVISEILMQVSRGLKNNDIIGENTSDATLRSDKQIKQDNSLSWAEFKSLLPAICNSIGIGALFGALPGIGTVPASYMSYGQAKNISKHPELFGKGSLEGVAAPEAGNNAVVGPNLIPLITLGIPGNLAAALVLGAFMIQGLKPGPLFMTEQAPMLYSLFTVLIISNVFILLVGNVFLHLMRSVRQIPRNILYPVVVLFCVIGTYADSSNWADVLIMFVFGLLGFVLMQLRIPLPPLLVSYILGKMFEERIRQTLTISGGDFWHFFSSPVSILFFILTVCVILFVGIGLKHVLHFFKIKADASMLKQE